MEEVELLVDPFNGGEMLGVADAEARLAPLYGADVQARGAAHRTLRPARPSARTLRGCARPLGPLEPTERFTDTPPGPQVKLDTSFFADAAPKPRPFLTRVLTNLKQLYWTSRDFEAALLVIDYALAAAPDARVRWMHLRDRGLCLFAARRAAEAAEALGAYLAEAGDAAPDRQRVLALIESAQQALRDQIVRDDFGGGGGGESGGGDDDTAGEQQA